MTQAVSEGIDGTGKHRSKPPQSAFAADGNGNGNGNSNSNSKTMNGKLI